MKKELDSLEVVLGYRFNEAVLLENALTHRSACSDNNERLEYLGDSVLNFVIAAELFKDYPKAPEGDLSRIRASLVNKDSLADVASKLGLGDWLHLGSGELKSGGYRRKSILADALEAIFGAIYLDAGFDKTREVILKCYKSSFDSPVDPESLKDPKTRLQEWLQARKKTIPFYELVDASGKPHEQTFTIRCVIEGFDQELIGKGKSRRKAEQNAAEMALSCITEKS